MKIEIVAICLLACVCWLIPAVMLGVTAMRRGLSGMIYFGIGLLFGPVLAVSLAHAPALADRTLAGNHDAMHAA